MENLVGWAAESSKKDFPSVVLAINMRMKENFMKYRDLLCVSIVDIVSGYKAALFGVMESNNRVLLAGTALFKE